MTVKDSNSLPPLKNPDILIGENDLTSLSYLHEPAGAFTRSQTFIVCTLLSAIYNCYIKCLQIC